MAAGRAKGASARLRAAAVLAAIVLALIGGTYYVTRQPAPDVFVFWREGVAPEQRTWVERRFGLVRVREGEKGALAYDLVDLHPLNIQDLLERPEVERMGFIDDRTYAVPAQISYGEGSMWIADRVPELRIYPVVPSVVAACGLVIAYALVLEVTARGKRLRRRLAFVVGSRRPRFGADRRLGVSEAPDSVDNDSERSS